MRRRTFLSALLCAALIAACERKTRLPTIAAGQTVLAFGDSVTFGTGARPGEDWPTLLAERTGWRVVNAGVPGDTAEAAKERIADLLDQHQPALVIVELGGNDFLRRRPPAAVKSDLRQIVRRIGESRAQIVLLAVPELSLLGLVTRKPSDAPIYGELASEEKIALIGDVFSNLLAHPELCADQIHPNAKGYQWMVSEIHARLKTLGLATSA